MKLKGLLLNDFYTLKDQYLSYIKILIPCMTLLGIVNAPEQINSLSDFSYLVLLLIILPMSLMMALFTYEEKCDYMKYIVTTPVTRKNYIQEKYIFYLLHIAGMLLLGNFLILLFSLISRYTPTVQDFQWLLKFSVGEFLISLIFGTWVIALSMRFRVSKVRVIMMVAMGVFVGITVSLTAATMNALINQVSAAGKISGIMIGTGIVLLLLTIWLFVMSFRWAERKEL